MAPGFARRSFIAALAAGVPPGSANAADAIRLGLLRTLSPAPFYIAQENGYFRDVGIEVTFRFFESAQPIAAAAVSNDIDVGLTALTGETGVPMLPNAAVVFECQSHSRFDGGDHEIFVGRVAAMHEHAINRGRPLVFFEGCYRQLASAADAHTPPHEAVLLHGW